MKQILAYCAFFIVLLFSVSSKAQYTSARGWFEVDFIRGCEGTTVNITSTGSAPVPCFAGANCVSEWGDGTQNQLDTHTYTDGGDFILTVYFQNDNPPDSIAIDINESLPPEFNLYACTGQRVAVNITDTGYDNYVIEHGTGPDDTVPAGAPDQIYTYSTTSSKTITVRGLDDNAADNCPGVSQNITPLSTLPSGSISSLEVVSDSELILNYNLADNILYRLQIVANGGNTYAPLKILTPDISNDTISGLNLTDNFYCFRIATLNTCDNTVDSYSTVVCSITPTLETLDGFNRLSWQSSNPEIDFDILRDDQNSTPLVTVSSATRTYDDMDISCNTEYCYTVVGNYNGATSTSIPVCGTTFSTIPPDPIQNITTAVSESGISITWPEPNASDSLVYSIYRNNNGQIVLLGKSDTTFFLTNALDTSTEHCFEIHSQDECGNQTLESIIGCSIVLTGEIDREDNISLQWPSHQGYTNGVSNYLVRKSYDGETWSASSTTDTTFSETDNSANQVIYYQIQANPNDNVDVSTSNILRLIKSNNIYFPNAFTPDGNGTNEIFRINGRFITSFELNIFNRWGEMVFASESMDSGWDGTLDGKNLPQGSYAFRSLMTDQAGRQIEKDGIIVLMRK